MAIILGGETGNMRVRSPLAVAMAVWHALFMREAAARLFAGRAAWLWLLIEPIAHALFLMLLFATVRDRTVEGVADFAPFLIVGVMGFQMFRYPATRCMGAIDASRALFTFRQVKPVDTVCVRAFLEGVIQIVVMAVLIFGMLMWGYKEAIPEDIIGFIVAYMTLWVTGWGLGMVLSTGTLLAPEFPKIMGLIFMPLYFASGVFFRPQNAPPEIREWLLWNPILHGIESLRGAMFPGYHLLPEINLGYLAGTALVLIFLGLTLQLRYARQLAAQ